MLNMILVPYINYLLKVGLYGQGDGDGSDDVQLNDSETFHGPDVQLPEITFQE